MKIQIDTTNKTIKLEDNVNLKDFFNKIKVMLPNGDWENFSLETNTNITSWSNPIIIREYIEKLKPVYPKTYEWYCSTGTIYSGGLKPGIYNVEC